MTSFNEWEKGLTSDVIAEQRPSRSREVVVLRPDKQLIDVLAAGMAARTFSFIG